MAKRTLYETEYLDELNARLKAHPQYEPWMKFSLSPDGSARHDARNFRQAGPNPIHPAYVSVTQSVEKDFDIEAALR